MNLLGNAILFSEMTPPSDRETTFNEWYDHEHIPLRMAAPRFRSAQRYRDGQTANYLAVYEMDDPDALATPEYGRIKNQPSETTRAMLGSVSGFTRYIGRMLATHGSLGADLSSAAVLYAVFFQVPAARVAEFDSWYAEDHVPLLLGDSKWIGTRRFEIVDGAPDQYNRLALHYLADRLVLDSEARAKARATPWRARLAQEPWFKGKYLLFDKIGARQLARAAP